MVKKTYRMELIELKRGQSLETLIPALYDQLGNTPDVATDLGISPVALYRWCEMLGLKTQTESRTTVIAYPPRQPVG